MSKKTYFRPDYRKLYPDVTISDEVLAFLKKSDRQTEYMEHDLKRDRIKYTRDGIRENLREREVSLERLLSEGLLFPSEDQEMEQAVCDKIDRYDELHRCLASLDGAEKALIQALYFDGYTESEHAITLGVTQQAIHKKRKKVLAKMKERLPFPNFGC